MTDQRGGAEGDRIVVAGDGQGDGDPEAAFAALRRGVPQTRRTHGFLARLRLVLRDRLPDVLTEVEAAGAQTLALTTTPGGPRPDDDVLASLIVRRTALESVLRLLARPPQVPPGAEGPSLAELLA